jgi:hypothetical protein
MMLQAGPRSSGLHWAAGGCVAVLAIWLWWSLRHSWPRPPRGPATSPGRAAAAGRNRLAALRVCCWRWSQVSEGLARQQDVAPSPRSQLSRGRGCVDGLGQQRRAMQL